MLRAARIAAASAKDKPEINLPGLTEALANTHIHAKDVSAFIETLAESITELDRERLKEQLSNVVQAASVSRAKHEGGGGDGR